MGFCRVKLLTLVNLNAPIVYTYGRKVEAKARYRTGNKARTKSNHNSFVSETCLEPSQNLHYYIID